MATLGFHTRNVDLSGLAFEADLEGRVYLYGVLTTDGASVSVEPHPGDAELGLLSNLPDGAGYAVTFVLDEIAVVYEYAPLPDIWPVRIIPARSTGEDATTLDVVLTSGASVLPTPTVTEIVPGAGDYAVTGLPTVTAGDYSLTWEAGLFANTTTWSVAETQLLVSVASMVAWLDDEVDESTLIAIEQGVVAFLENLTGRLLTVPEQPVVEILDGAKRRGGRLLRRVSDDDPECVLLREAPTSPILSVSYRNAMSEDWEAQDLANFEADGRTLYVTDGYLPVGKRLVRVRYPFGYAEDGGPPDVHLLILQMVQAILARRDVCGDESITVGSFKLSAGDLGEKAEVFMKKAMAMLGRGENFA